LVAQLIASLAVLRVDTAQRVTLVHHLYTQPFNKT